MTGDGKNRKWAPAIRAAVGVASPLSTTTTMNNQSVAKTVVCGQEQSQQLQATKTAY